MYLYLPCEKKQEPAHLQINLQPSGESGLTWTMKIKAINKDASTEQPSSTDICSINCFLVAPLTVRKRHSRTRCRKRSI